MTLPCHVITKWRQFWAIFDGTDFIVIPKFQKGEYVQENKKCMLSNISKRKYMYVDMYMYMYMYKAHVVIVYY